MGFSVANPLRDKEFLELARRDAFALVEDKVEPGALEKLLSQLDVTWRRRYQLAHVG
jgi:hypothetical protein